MGRVYPAQWCADKHDAQTSVLLQRVLAQALHKQPCSLVWELEMCIWHVALPLVASHLQSKWCVKTLHKINQVSAISGPRPSQEGHSLEKGHAVATTHGGCSIKD